MAVTISAIPLSIGPESLPAGRIGEAYSQTIVASGGTGPYRYSHTNGSLPEGLSLSADGVLSGTPSAAGTANFTVRATGSSIGTVAVEGTKNYSLQINPEAPKANAVSATVSANSSINYIILDVSGKTADTTVAIASQASNGTVGLSNNQAVKYTPNAGFAGTDSFTYTASNGGGTSEPATVTITVSATPLLISPGGEVLPAGKVGDAYSQTITASGGAAPYRYSITGGALPQGLSLSGDGVLSGTPTTPVTDAELNDPFAVTVTDSSSPALTGTRYYRITMNDAAPIANDVSATFRQANRPITLNITGGKATSVAVATQPGNGVATASGTSITYTPNAGFSGTDSFTYTASNVSGTSAEATVSVNVITPMLVMIFSPQWERLSASNVGYPYRQTISVTGGVAPYRYSLTGGALPQGLSLSEDGVISGTPTTTGVPGFGDLKQFTITVTDSLNNSEFKAYSFRVERAFAPVASPSFVTVATNSAGNSIPLTLTGGGAISVAVATEPGNGVATASGTSMTYTPNAGFSGSDSFTYTVTGLGGTSVPARVGITVSPTTLVISPSAGNLPAGEFGYPYRQALTAEGGTAPYSYDVTGGALPRGLRLSVDGVISGTPSEVGTANFAVTVSDSSAGAAAIKGTVTYTIKVTDVIPLAKPVSASVMANSFGNLITPNFAGGSAGWFDVVSQPGNGVAESSGETIRYTPKAGYVGSDSFTYTASNSAGTSAPATVTVTISAMPLSIGPESLPAGRIGEAYSQTIVASGGTGPYSYSHTNGSLPEGLSLSADGVLSGTPSAAGTANFTVRATGSSTGTWAAEGIKNYSLQINPGAPKANAVSATVSANSSINYIILDVSGKTADTTVAIASQASNGTVGLSTNEAVTYIPNAGFIGTDSFTYTASNGGGTSEPATATITVSATPLLISPGGETLPAGKVGDAYSQTITASGGAAPYRYSITGGALPQGLSLSGDGVLSGTPTNPELIDIDPFAVTVTDSSTPALTGTQYYRIAINNAAPIANDVSATVRQPNSPITLNITGGKATSVAVATQPGNGVATASGTSITYTPNAGFSGTDSFTYTASNVSGTSAEATVSLAVPIPMHALVLSPAADDLPETWLGATYYQLIRASDGTAPYHYSVTGGALPQGLSLSTSGVISGTSETAGTANFTVTATDSSNLDGTQDYTLVVFSSAAYAEDVDAKVTINSIDNPILLTIKGGAATSIAIVKAPDNGVATVTGTSITYTPNREYTGPDSFTYTATNEAGTSAPATISVKVGEASGAITFTPASGSLGNAMAGEDYRTQITAAGGAQPILYRISSGSLPKGMVLNMSTGELTGPTEEGTEGDYTFTIVAQDNSGMTGSATYRLVVTPRAVTASDMVVNVPAGSTPPDVYLNRGATGAPFVSATIMSIEPANAGTATIIRGTLGQAGPAAAPVGWYLQFRPKPGFSGTVKVGYRLVGALGTSNTGTVTYNIAFDAAQVAEEMNVLVRGFVSTRQGLIANGIYVPGLLERRQMQEAKDPVTARMTPSQEGMTARFSTSLAQLDAARDNADGIDGGIPPAFNAWIDGAFFLHKRDQNEGQWGSFAMLNLGVDYLLTDRALMGFSFHFDRMRDPSRMDAELTGNGWLAGPYVSLELGKGVYWDTSLLYGGSSNAIDTLSWDGSFSTSRWVIDTAIKGSWQLDEATVLTPKLRALYFNEKVNDYSVSNTDGYSIAIDGFDVSQFRWSLGADIARSIIMEDGSTLTPKIGATAGFAGMDGSGAFGSVSAGLSYETVDSWLLTSDILFNIGGDGETTTGGKVGVGKRF